MLTAVIAERMPFCRENGYFALRFLAEDADKNVNNIMSMSLPTITRPLAGR
jgi:hypothetical protein